ncbi:hypothetical protein AAFF_G00040070 [Aldrovandia affinis]|uniref:Uncharacterized protein n=1 Tax=Aldrovandia affinis TaxID=143900 RepID=A0AAD7S326_9TELE|nr:hypothetical protein AAFF_G00040070 [Aldrovandia affinis]
MTVMTTVRCECGDRSEPLRPRVDRVWGKADRPALGPGTLCRGHPIRRPARRKVPKPEGKEKTRGPLYESRPRLNPRVNTDRAVVLSSRTGATTVPVVSWPGPPLGQFSSHAFTML